MPETQQSSSLRTTRTSELYERMRQDIVSCVIAPGQKLQMEMLRVRYGAGSSPVREALNRLVTEGLVTQVDQKGFRAAPVNVDEVMDLTRARCWIGEAALAASIKSGGPEWEEAILLAFHRWERGMRMTGRSDQHSFVSAHALHRDFHRALLAACGSKWMLNFWDTSFDFAQRYQVISIANGATERRDPVKEHRELMEAALERDLEKAIALHNQHLQLTAEIVIASNSGVAESMKDKAR